MEELLKPRMNLRKWYGSSLKIPAFGTYPFVDFVVSSFGIVNTIVREKMGKDIRVTFMNGGSAHADWENLTIAINEEFLTGNIAGQTLDSETTLTTLLGIEVHEAAHFAFSPSDLSPFSDYVKEKTTCVFHQEVAATIGNIIEDVYIEAEVDREVPSLVWFLEGMNDVFFTSFSEWNTMDTAMGITEAPENLIGVSHALNVLLFAKTRNKVDTTPYLNDLFQVVLSAKDEPYLSGRCELVLQIYNSLMAKITQEECDASQSGKGKDGEESENGKKAGEALGESKKRSEGLTAAHGGKAETGLVAAKEATTRTIKSALERISDCDLYFVPDESRFDTSLYIEKTVPHGTPIVADKRYAEIAEIARQRSTVNRPYGMDRNRGHNIRKLYRIGTDSKIFAEPVTMSTYQPMQVIILIDCSGSMNNDGSVRGKSRIQEAASASLGAASALVDARCQVAVFAHTGDIITRNEVTLFVAKNFNEPINVLGPRLGNIVNNQPHSENRDGFAIAHVGKKFTTNNKRRLLIVISDGEPAATRYYGPSANMHTREEVNKLRKKGVDVLSISITEEANKVNRTIYGEDKNVYNRNPNIIREIVSSLITN